MDRDPKTSTIDLPPLAIRAAVDSVDEENRTVELVFSTGAAVERYDWMKGERFLEVLSLDKDAVRLERLNNSAPLLNAHSAWSLTDQLGVVEPGTAQIESGEGRATVRFSKRADVEPIWGDIKDGIIRNVSVGYRVYKFEETTGADGQMPQREAVDWEPFEISMVPMGADDGAKVRAEPSILNPCVLVTRNEQEKEDMGDETRKDEKVEAAQTPTKADEQTPATTPPTSEAEAREAGAKEERERQAAIRTSVRAAKLDDAFADELVEDGVSANEARKRVIDKLADDAGNTEGPGDGAQRIVPVPGEDERDKRRRGMIAALLNKTSSINTIRAAAEKNPDRAEFKDIDLDGGEYRNMRLLRMAEECVEAVGVRAAGLPPMQIAGIALGYTRAPGQHSTSDFPFILADAAGKTLRAAYEEAPRTFQVLARRVTLPDFKTVKRNQLGEAPQLLEVVEGAEFTHGTIGEGRETYQLTTYGRVFAITRQAIINDDLDAFSRIPELFGRSARDLESSTVYTHFLSNPTMGDAVALFDAAHGNIGTGAISVANIGAGRTAMRKQTGLDGVQYINVQASYLLVPAALETTADQFVSQNMLADAAGNINVFAGRLTVVAEPRLDADSAVQWYLVADPGQVDTIEYGYLEGEDGPMVESRVGFDVDGVEIKCRHDFAAKVIDHRGFYRSSGV